MKECLERVWHTVGAQSVPVFFRVLFIAVWVSPMGPGQPGLWTAWGSRWKGRRAGLGLEGHSQNHGAVEASGKLQSEEETKLDLAQAQHTWRTGGGDPRSEQHGRLTVPRAQLGA